MPINSVGGYYNSSNVYGTQKTDTKSAVEELNEELEAAQESTAKTERKDGFTRSHHSDVEVDTDKLRQVKQSMHRNSGAFEMMVKGTATKQANFISDKLKEITAAKTEEVDALENDPEWGVEATAKRLLDFAKTISGGDVSKADMLMDAVEKGFKAAEKVLGGLPSISQKTLEKVREGFKEWKEGLDKTADDE